MYKVIVQEQYNNLAAECQMQWTQTPVEDQQQVTVDEQHLPDTFQPTTPKPNNKTTTKLIRVNNLSLSLWLPQQGICNPAHQIFSKFPGFLAEISGKYHNIFFTNIYPALNICSANRKWIFEYFKI